MTATPEQAAWFRGQVENLVGNIEAAIVGKRDVVLLAVVCLLTRGHLLIEDVPGTGKTSLAKSLANSLDGMHKRIQFTPDLLPSDVTGTSIWDQDRRAFVFHPGPVFATIVLADEINRASPKTQSALLEVMEEGFVTVDGDRHAVPHPFMVIATQNPVELSGTYRLPEAQLDRFLIRTSIGLPAHRDLVAILAESAVRSRADAVQPLIEGATVAKMSALAADAHASEAILGYVGDIVEATVRHPALDLGVSVRGAIALIRASRTWAMSHGRHYVTPDDIKALAAPVLAHRLVLRPDAEFEGATSGGVLGEVLAGIQPPVDAVSW